MKPGDAVYAPTYVVEHARAELLVRESDAATRAACSLAGHLPHLPPVPAALGAGAAIPDRRRELGLPVPLSGTRRSAAPPRWWE